MVFFSNFSLFDARSSVGRKTSALAWITHGAARTWPRPITRGEPRIRACRSTPPRLVAELSAGGRQAGGKSSGACCRNPKTPDHGRADLRADAAGGSRSCSRPCASWRERGNINPLQISHKLEEDPQPVQNTPRVLAARQGGRHCDPREKSARELAEMNGGDTLHHPPPHRLLTEGETVLELKRACR